MKVAYIYDAKQQRTGAHQINHLIVTQLRQLGVTVKTYYPTLEMVESEVRFKGLRNILFFHSLLEQKKDILKADLIQGTTYTPLSFLGFGIPVVCHFGSTALGILTATPQSHRLEDGGRQVMNDLRSQGVLSDLNMKTTQPMRDIAEVELYTALLADLVIATSLKVKEELISYGLPEDKVKVVHNGIDDYWLDRPIARMGNPQLVFLGRISNDAFNWKLKGVDRLITLYKAFPKIPKLTIAMTDNERLGPWLEENIKSHTLLLNKPKEEICDILQPLRGSIILITSRYEGFSLSLVEAMSRGLIPIAYSVGVVPEIVKNGENGYIVKNVAHAKLRIRKILADPALREKLSREASRTAKQFRAEALARKLNELYTEVVSGAEGKASALTLASNTDESSAKAKQKIKKAVELAARTSKLESQK